MNSSESELKITTLFLDVGGVLLTNGWDHDQRKQAASKFSLDYEEMSNRHHLTFDTYEYGKLALEEYLHRVVFYQDRSFSMDEFKQFMFGLSQPLPGMIDLFKALKAKYRLKIAVTSNEGRELALYRTSRFKMKEFVDFFLFSGFIHLRKPDTDFYRLALDVAQVLPHNVVYIDDRAMLVDVARSMGIAGIVQKSFEYTRNKLAELGLFL
jgi:putative hydrolase of the HAD superfamily